MQIPSSPEQWAAIEPNETDNMLAYQWRFQNSPDYKADWLAAASRLLERERISNEDRTGSGIIKCHACGEEFWAPGTLNIAMHASEEWRKAFEARIRSSERERCVEALAEWLAKVGPRQGLRFAEARRILGVAS